MSASLSLINGNALHIPLTDSVVQCVITSPPYYGLRDYGVDGQIGLEQSPEEYVSKLVDVFREIWRVMRHDGTLWLNLGDSYAGSGGPGNQYDNKSSNGFKGAFTKYDNPNRVVKGLKPKDLIGIPWRVAFALQADGWYLRSDIIWHKPNPMPESVTDRPTKSHEYLFLLAKAERYYYDADAISEDVTGSTITRLSQNIDGQTGSERANGGNKTNGNMKAVGKAYFFARSVNECPPPGQRNQHREDREEIEYTGKRNRRTVWTIPTRPYSGAHFATFPPALVEPCILAGSRPGDLVMDPFSGTSTVGEVAIQHRRRYIGIELNPEYLPLAIDRTNGTQIYMI